MTTRKRDPKLAPEPEIIAPEPVVTVTMPELRPGECRADDCSRPGNHGGWCCEHYRGMS